MLQLSGCRAVAVLTLLCDPSRRTALPRLLPTAPSSLYAFPALPGSRVPRSCCHCTLLPIPAVISGVAKGGHGRAFAQPSQTFAQPSQVAYDSREDSQQRTKPPYFDTVRRKHVPHLLNHDFRRDRDR